MKKAYSVLVVDDDKFLLEMYKKKLEISGLKVEIAVGSDECLDKLRSGATPDILVFDIIMPKMDGIELLATVRKENLSPNSLVIMLTNENTPERIARAKDLGVAGYIVKATTVPSEVVQEIITIADAHTN